MCVSVWVHILSSWHPSYQTTTASFPVCWNSVFSPFFAPYGLMHNPVRYFWQRQVKVNKHLSIDSQGLKVIRTCLRSSHVPGLRQTIYAEMFCDNEPSFCCTFPGDMSKTEREVISMFSEVSHAFGVKRRGDTCRIHAMKNNIFIQVHAPDLLINTFQNGTRLQMWHVFVLF